MRNIKLTIEYDGTAYHGWQSQVNAAAVQDVVSAAVQKLTGEKCILHGSSRTDAGVHAYGQVANFHTASGIPADKFAFALNTMLPDDISVVGSEEAEPGFHARFSAKGKRYRYLFWNSLFSSAIMRNRAWHVYYPLDVEAMRRASGNFLGTHDFLAFSASGSSVKTTVRTVCGISVSGDSPEQSCRPEQSCHSERSEESYNLQKILRYAQDDKRYAQDDKNMSSEGKRTVPIAAKRESRPPVPQLEQENRPPVPPLEYAGTVSLDVEGDGFLYNMVRIIAGTLVEVGYGRIAPEDIPAILESRDRRRAGLTAPPQGLYLMEVFY